MNDIIAMNLLGDRTCENCFYSAHYIKDLFKCSVNIGDDAIYQMCPDIETCEKWKERK